MSTQAPVISYDYAFSPYAQKVHLLLTAANIPFHRVEVSPVLPRQELVDLGIEYRRIPVLAIGKDIYADSSLIIHKILTKLGAGSKVKQTVADKAFEAWAQVVFFDSLSLAPAELLSEGFVKDREAVFPILARPDFKSLRPSGLAEFAARLREVEEGFLASAPGTFLGGDQVSLADIHAIFGLRWVLNDLGVKKEPGFGPESFPKVWKLIESLPKANAPILTGADAAKVIDESSFTENNVTVEKDYTEFSQGAQVSIESTDTAAGAFAQKGKLLGLNKDEIVIEVARGLRLHYPRIGYILRQA